MNLLSAKCPNCGANLEIPMNNNIFTCEYCKASVILDDLDEYKKMPNGKKYYVLANSYYDINDYKQALTYCDKLLEYEPKNPYAWLTKGKVTYKLSDRFNNKIFEALKYIMKSIEYSKNTINKPFESDLMIFVNEMLINYHSNNIFLNASYPSLSLYYNSECVKEMIIISDNFKGINNEYLQNIKRVCKDNIKYGKHDSFWHDRLIELDITDYNEFIKELEIIKQKEKLYTEKEARKRIQLEESKNEMGNRKANYIYMRNFGFIGVLIGLSTSIILKIVNLISTLQLIVYAITVCILFILFGYYLAKTKNK